MHLRFLWPNFRKGTGLFLVLALLLSCSSGGSESTETVSPPPDTSYKTPPNGTRDWLDHAELQSMNQGVGSPYHNDYFMPIGAVEEAHHNFHGKLTIHGRSMAGWPSNWPPDMKLFPSVDISFFSHGDYLVPKNRDIIIPETEDSYWRIIFSPGKTWFESGDQGMSRASFPFVLVERSYNSTMNGLATFLFDEDSVSNLRVQIVQHTAPGLLGEAAVTLPIDYDTTPNEAVGELQIQFENELAEMVPWQPWDSLLQQFSDLDWNHYYSQISPENISLTAVWLNNQLFVKPPETKYGLYPYPRFMRHGIYSATKSAAGALALSFLAQRYGPEVLDYRIRDYLEVSAPHDGWDDVRFIDCLNMATGIGNNEPDPNSTETNADESGPITGEWSRAKTAKEKLDIGFQRYGNFEWGPGEIFRYNTQHTFVLSAAMDALTRQNEDIGLWQLMKTHVYEPIGIQHTPMMHTTEPDGSRGVPIIGVGLTPTMDHALKMARLFHQLGMHDDQQILHQETVQNALFRGEEAGLSSHVHNNQYGDSRYHFSFWTIPFAENECEMQVPFMSGAGGNLIPILPNGVIGFRFTDQGINDAKDMVEILAQLKPICH